MEYLIIDGYNIINSWNDIFNLEEDTLEECRDRLLDIMLNYHGYRKINIVIVFDAHQVKGNRRSVERYAGVKLVYTKENETADQYIERFVYQNSREYTIRVATSDYLEQILVLNSGGIRMSARELRNEVEAVNKKIKEKIENKPIKSNSIMGSIPQNILEKLEKIRRSKF